jgi:hypothetical protein
MEYRNMFDFATIMLPVIAAWILFMKTRKVSTAIFFGGLLIGAILVFSLRLNLITRLGLNEVLSETATFWLAYIVSFVSNLGFLVFVLSLPKLRKALTHHSSGTPNGAP